MRLLLSLFVIVCSIHAKVVTGKDAPQLEKFAAAELERYATQLFGDRGPQSKITFLIGSPTTNHDVAGALGQKRFASTPQGYSIIPARWHGRPTLIVGGGSPAATLWAVYDLVERWGVRYLLHRDIMPARANFLVPKTAIHREPILPIRQWRIVNELAFGPASWGIADYRPFLNQLAKLRFNRVLISLWSHQPFLRYEFKGITRRSSSMFFGQRFPLTDDLPGRKAFSPASSEFENPDIPANLSGEARLQAGIEHVRNIIQHARARGMEVVISANISDFPREFASLLSDWRTVRQVGQLTVIPGPEVRPEDNNLLGLSRTILRATLDTYPEASRVALSVPEHRQWTDAYQRAWDRLDEKYAVGRTESLESILARSENRRGFHGGAARAQAEVKGDIVSLYFYDQLLEGGKLVTQTRNPNATFVFSSVAEELAPLLPKVLPPGSEMLSFIDYTPSRVLRRIDALRSVPTASMPSVLIFTLHDDNVGLLPQSATKSLAQLTEEITRSGWKGFSTRYWLIGDHDTTAAYLSKASWDSAVTPEQIYRELFTALSGSRSMAALIRAQDALEAATTKLEWHGLGFAFPVDGMLMKHWSEKPLAPELLSALGDYRRSLRSIQQAIRVSEPQGLPDLEYLAGRLQFGIAYLQCVSLVQEAAVAQASSHPAEAHNRAQRAFEALRRGIESYAAVARDQSDRGAIASLYEFAFRPLRRRISELQ
jgi:hypothetical protein